MFSTVFLRRHQILRGLVAPAATAKYFRSTKVCNSVLLWAYAVPLVVAALMYWAGRLKGNLAASFMPAPADPHSVTWAMLSVVILALSVTPIVGVIMSTALMTLGKAIGVDNLSWRKQFAIGGWAVICSTAWLTLVRTIEGMTGWVLLPGPAWQLFMVAAAVGIAWGRSCSTPRRFWLVFWLAFVLLLVLLTLTVEFLPRLLGLSAA